jgi:hypothetical protein
MKNNKQHQSYSKQDLFSICFRNITAERNNKLINEFQIDVEKFERFLIKTSLEDYSEELLNVGLNFIFSKANPVIVKRSGMSIDNHMPSVIEDELSKTLIYLLSNKNNEISLILKSQGKYVDNFKIESQFIIAQITENLINTYKNKGYNLERMSFDEAQQEINTNPDNDWLNEYCRYYEGDDLIQRYGEMHYIEREITIEFLKSKLKIKKKEKVGAKPKNLELSELVERLSYLLRFERYLNQDEYFDFSKYPLKNKGCLLIFEFLSFFNLLEGYIITSNPENYIKAILKNFDTYKKKEKFDYAQRFKSIQSMDFWSDYANQAINFIKETGYKNIDAELKAPYIIYNWYI